MEKKRGWDRKREEWEGRKKRREEEKERERRERGNKLERVRKYGKREPKGGKEKGAEE